MISLALLLAAAPIPGELKTFRDWIVGCDNGRACQAVSLVPEGGERVATIVARRDAGPAAVPSIRISRGEVMASAIRLPNRSIAIGAGGAIAPGDIGPLLGVLRSAPRLDLIDRAGKPVGTVSLDGASAALLYIDDRQGRIGTRTALARPGAKPAAVVPAAPPLPVISTPPTGRTPAERLAIADARRNAGDASCGTDLSLYQPQTWRLDARSTLALVPRPCDNGAYNYFVSIVLISGGKARPAGFDADGGMGEPDRPPNNILVNPEWDPKRRRLTSFAKGRGLGDCGVRSSFAWDGARFLLAERSEMGECRGSVDYITTWRARVVTR